MNSITLNTTKNIRFRRWSRAGYAVFNSLGSYITIGNVVVSISDKSLQKSESNSFNNSDVSRSEMAADNSMPIESELESALIEIQLATLSEITFDAVVACDFYTTKYFIHHCG